MGKLVVLCVLLFPVLVLECAEDEWKTPASLAEQEVESAVRTLLDASTKLAAAAEQIAQEGYCQIDLGRLARYDYPSANPRARAARRLLLEHGLECVPAVLAELDACALEQHAGLTRAAFANTLLAELAGGHFGWRSAIEPDSAALRYDAQVIRAWRDWWERLRTAGEPVVGSAANAEAADAALLSFIPIESVLPSGAELRVRTKADELVVTAGLGFERSYTWAGATRSVVLDPRSKRWYGSLGLYYSGPGDHWEVHDGITRAVLGEGEQHFADEADALEWLGTLTWLPHVHTRTGLVVSWGTVPSRQQLNVDVWQIYVDGEKPTELPGSRDEDVLLRLPEGAGHRSG